MIAYELLAHLNNLVLTADDGKLEWVGTNDQRLQAINDIYDYEKSI